MERKKTRTRESELDIQNRWLRRANARLRRQTSLLEQRNMELRKATIIDELTGALNRRGLYQQLNQRLALLRRRDGSSEESMQVLLYIDLNDFKKVNDQAGHAVGDAVLIEVVKNLHSTLREVDVLARMGGDEFIVLAEVKSETDSKELVSRVRSTITSTRIKALGQQWSVGASIGAVVLEKSSTAEKVIKRADDLMFKEKTPARA